MFKHLGVIILLLFLSSCSSGLYSHYPKAKKKGKKITAKPFHKHLYVPLTIKSKTFTTSKQNVSIKTLEVDFVPVSKKVTSANSLTHPLGDGKPRDATRTNKNAKWAFASSLITLGSLGAGIFVAPFFLLIMMAFAATAFVFSVIALKQIKKTGEYGRSKAEFALYTSIPILVLSIFGLLAYQMSNGAGIQIGNFVLN